jgi:CHAD domain-containing protein
MVSKLKQRRLRRLKADIAWWMAEAQDWKDIAMEHAVEIDRLKKLVIRVPMPVVVPESVADELKLREVG